MRDRRLQPSQSVYRFPTILTHRVATHLDSVSVVNQSVEDAIGYGRITDLFMPAGDGQLRRENQRADLIAVLANLPEVPALWFRQRRHSPIVDHQHVNPAQP